MTCGCMAKYLYDKCGAKTYEKSTAVDDTSWPSSDPIATAASTGRLFITYISVQFDTAGRTMNFGVDANGDLFTGITATGVILFPIIFDLENCPIVLDAGESIGAIVSAGTSYVTVRGYQK